MKFPEALTFDDVLLVPASSSVLPGDADTTTRLTRTIEMGIPLLSDTHVDDALLQFRTIMLIVDRQWPPDQQVAYETQIGWNAAGHVMDLIALTLTS